MRAECLQLFNRFDTLVHTPSGASRPRERSRRPFIVPEIANDITKAAKDVANVARDATYVVIGAGVLAFQRAQVERQELLKRLSDPRAGLEHRLSAVRSDLGDTVQATEARVEELMDRLENVIERVEAAVAPLEDRLPDQARDMAKQAHAQAREARTQLRTFLPGAAA